jgi:SAM-dependent methyltransferase
MISQSNLNSPVALIFNGRHHMLTKFQQQYLAGLVAQGVNGRPVKEIIFAITSANHENTRRNPVSLYLRALAIEDFARNLKCEFRIYPIKDVPATPKFVSYLLKQINYQGGQVLSPDSSFFICSTPSVINLIEQAGFGHLPTELEDRQKETYATLRPYEVIDLLVKAGASWRTDQEWWKFASVETQTLYDKYNLGDLIVELFTDAILTDDAELTDTRDYNTYARSMDNAAQFKFDDVRPFTVQGKIVDAGCGTGALVALLAREFSESDIIGIEGTRKFYEYCKMQDYPNPYVYFYRRNLTDELFKTGTINTFIYSSVLHEIYSYIGQDALKSVLAKTFNQLASGGRIVIRDVVGPDEPDKTVYLQLNQEDGLSEGDIDKLSTYAKFFRFFQDFKPRTVKYEAVELNGVKLIKLRVQDAYEYLSKMKYTDNWESEMHEEFGFYSFSQWESLLQEIGYRIVPGSKPFTNQYIIENHYKSRGQLFTLTDQVLVPEPYPYTNMILAGEKPSV